MTNVTIEEDFLNFPPFFTLQPVETTRLKQLSLWKKLIMDWFSKPENHSQQSVIVLDSFALFFNDKIDRRLNPEERIAVAEHLIASGHAEWKEQDESIYVYIKTPVELASIIFDFVQSNGLFETVFTLYELLSGDLTSGTPIYGMNQNLCLSALQILSKKGKADIYLNKENIDETGVKFLN